MPHFVYIARCSDDSLYTGTCIDLKAREAKHNAGEGAKYTRSRLPVRFVYSEVCKTLGESRSREAAIKRLPREGKLQLIRHSVLSFSMAMKKSRTKVKKDITLRDVIVHMENMQQQLSGQIAGNTAAITQNSRDIAQNSRDIAQNSTDIQDLKQTLTERIDALEEDLTATMKETYAIRKHVGMVTSHDE